MKPQKEQMMKDAFWAFKEAGLCWESFNQDMHWKINGVNFYPTTHRWFDIRKDYRGEGIKQFTKYIRTRQQKDESIAKQLTVDELFEIAKHVKPQSLYAILEAIHKGIYQ